MNDPVIYLTAGEVRSFNEEILRLAGKASSFLREEGLLDSAVQRPQNVAYYAGADLITQAAYYMVGIALNHPFVDGNKRTGFMAGMTFLWLNNAINRSVNLDQPEIGAKLEQVVKRELSFEEFVEELRRYISG